MDGSVINTADTIAPIYPSIASSFYQQAFDLKKSSIPKKEIQLLEYACGFTSDQPPGQNEYLIYKMSVDILMKFSGNNT